MTFFKIIIGYLFPRRRKKPVHGPLRRQTAFSTIEVEKNALGFPPQPRIRIAKGVDEGTSSSEIMSKSNGEQRMNGPSK